MLGEPAIRRLVQLAQHLLEIPLARIFTAIWSQDPCLEPCRLVLSSATNERALSTTPSARPQCFAPVGCFTATKGHGRGYWREMFRFVSCRRQPRASSTHPVQPVSAYGRYPPSKSRSSSFHYQNSPIHPLGQVLLQEEGHGHRHGHRHGHGPLCSQHRLQGPALTAAERPWSITLVRPQKPTASLQ